MPDEKAFFAKNSLLEKSYDEQSLPGEKAFHAKILHITKEMSIDEESLPSKMAVYTQVKKT